MYDVIIVGARVAGAPTAMLLARRGLKVLVVDRATFPSDTLSTHQVQLPGVARLARWGVLDAVLAAGTPVTRDVRFDQGDTVITGRYPGYQGVEAMCSPRRTLLDRVLVDAARAAGAEVRENFAVEEIFGDGQVTGIRGREKGAPAVTERARLVIGADGKHSLVAKAAGARAYRTRPPRSIAFYTSPTAPAGPSSVTSACCSTRSPARVLARPSATRNCWPTPSPTGSAASGRWPRRSAVTTGPATAPPGRCTTSPPGWPRSAHQRPPRSRSSGRSRAARRTPTCSSARWPARFRCASSCRRAPWCDWSAWAGPPG